MLEICILCEAVIREGILKYKMHQKKYCCSGVTREVFHFQTWCDIEWQYHNSPSLYDFSLWAPRKLISFPKPLNSSAKTYHRRTGQFGPAAVILAS